MSPPQTVEKAMFQLPPKHGFFYSPLFVTIRYTADRSVIAVIEYPFGFLF